MSKTFYCILTLLFLLNAIFGQIKNVTISQVNTPNELSISINPIKPNEIIAGSNHNNFYFSTDSGKTWKTEFVISKHGVWGDPVTLINHKGQYFFFHLSNDKSGEWIDRIVCQRKSNLYQKWELDTFFGLNGKKAQDKHWVIENKATHQLYATWTQFDKYGSKLDKHVSKIMFSTSTNDGKTWSQATSINTINGNCVDDDQTVEGAVPAIDKNGNLYVAWARNEEIVLQKSTNNGETWQTKETFVAKQPGGWVYKIPGIYRTNGLPITKTDLSNSAFANTIYVNFTDQRNDTNNTDVFLVSSNNGGKSWTPPVKVNQDSEIAHQFLTWMDVDANTGYIYIVYFDRRNHFDNGTDVFLSISKNGGKTFEDFQISQEPFFPNASTFFGDYLNVDVEAGVFAAAWNCLNNKKLSAKSLVLPVAELNKLPNQNTQELIAFFNAPTKVNIKVYNSIGTLIKTIESNKLITSQKFIYPLNKTVLEGLSGKVYFEISSKNQVYCRKVINLTS